MCSTNSNVTPTALTINVTPRGKIMHINVRTGYIMFLIPLSFALFKSNSTLKMYLFMDFSLARATLVLIPLLGIHEVVFTVLIDECVDGSSRYARNFVNLTLSSFQVTPLIQIIHLMRILFCSKTAL